MVSYLLIPYFHKYSGVKKMSIAVDKKVHYKTIDKTCYTANILYLILHIFYLVLFIIAKTYILVYVDAAVIAIYLAFFALIKMKKYYLYALICGNEFFAFVSVTTIMLGFNAGFHFYLIALCVVSFFTSYFSKSKDVRGSIFWVFLSLVIYLVLYFVTEFNKPYYVIDKWLEITLFTTHAIVVFSFICTYLMVFIKYALSLENKIINESRTDELTQINNRYALYDYFDQVEDKSTMVLALFDIDDFKNINDKYGHVTGDFILKRVAEMANNGIEDAFVCRYGGEEFVIVFNLDGKQTAFEKLEAFRKSIEQETFEYDGVVHNITITIGAANFVKDMTLEKWVNIADEKMYSGKKSGKNKTVTKF